MCPGNNYSPCTLQIIQSLRYLHDKISPHFYSAEVGLFHGREVLNHGIVYLQDIGEHHTALLCLTNNTHCCSRQYTYGGTIQGQWYFPNGTSVPNRGSYYIFDGHYWKFYRDRGLGVVRMHRRRGGVVGIYRCEIPDANGVNQTLFVGLYNQGSGTLMHCRKHNILIHKNHVFQLLAHMHVKSTGSDPSETFTRILECDSNRCLANKRHIKRLYTRSIGVGAGPVGPVLAGVK